MNDALLAWLDRIERVPVVLRFVGVITYLGVVVLIDLTTGPDLTLSFGYALVGMAAGWLLGWHAGLVIVSVAAGSGLVVNLIAEREQDLPVIFLNHSLRLLSMLLLTSLTVLAHHSIASLATSARVDQMTGALNKQGFVQALGRARRNAVRSGEPLAVVYFDLDGLKVVNDRDGHAAGDALIRRFADRVARHLRATDPFGRLGGDEFAVVLERAESNAIDLVVRRILDDPGLPSVSCGVRTYRGAYPSPSAMLEGADRRMYQDKRTRQLRP